MGGVWVASGPGLPCGARRLGDAHDGRVWVDVCILGQHLPQMRRPAEIHDLDAAGCAQLGLCPDCLGFGDTDPALAASLGEAARGIDEITAACPGCGGTGRPAIRVSLARDGGSVTGSIRPLPHAYVPPLPGAGPDLAAAFSMPPDGCLACGMPAAATGPREEALHP